MYDVITVGSSTVDVFAKVESELIKIKTVHHTDELIAYPCGTKILINDLEFLTGGGGTNTATSFSRLGLKTAYLGKIGNDNNSKLILNMLKREKIDFVGKKSKGVSGYSIILDSLENDRTILAYKGVNNSLEYKEINLNKIKTKWFYFSSMMGKSFETLERLAELAAYKKIKIAFNPSNYLAEKGHLYLKEILSRTEALILNKEEAMLIGGNHKIPDLIHRLMDLGPNIVVITDGKRGAYTAHKNKAIKVLPNDVKCVESTGAGDAFASTFIAGIIRKKSIDFSMKMALINAESVIQNQGAKNGLLTNRKLMSTLKKNSPKIKKI
jgi:ribokinase